MFSIFSFLFGEIGFLSYFYISFCIVFIVLLEPEGRNSIVFFCNAKLEVCKNVRVYSCSIPPVGSAFVFCPKQAEQK